MTNCLFWTDLNIGWHGTAYITGWLLLLILIIMVVSSLPFVRRRNYFEWFYNLHQLYIPYTLLLMLHGPNFWKWVIGPGLLRLVECVIDRQNYATEVTDATILPSGVINLNIKRPDDFHFYPGDYVLINIPKIARNEWHPFTISSAPEQLEIISLHIKTSGEWTRNLYESYDTLGNVQVECSTGPRLSIADTSIKWKETEQRQQLTTDLTTPVNLSPVQQCTLNVDESFGHTNLSFQPDQTVDVAAPSIAIGTPIKQVFARNAECIALAALPRGKDCRLFNECPIPSPRRIKNTPSTPNATTTIGTNRSMPMESFEALTMRKTIRFPTRILMAGPYSSASSDIFQAEHAVLIAAGIGVTPSASILQSIMLRHEQACHRCPNCEHVFCEARPVTLNKLRKVDFVWVDRSQQSFEWFVQLMAQLEATQNKLRQKDRFLDMHMYVTSARDPSDMKAVGLLLAMDLLQQNYERDLITGLQSRTRAGRPNWDTFFLDLSRQKRGKVTVFFCGGPTMGREIQKHCQKYGFVFRKENF